MTLIILLRGRKKWKRIEGRTGKFAVTPSLAANEHSIGICFEIDGAEPERWFWGTIHPRSVLWYFRAMKLFELLPEIRIHGSVNLCWEATRRTYVYEFPVTLKKLVVTLGSEERAEIVLGRVLASAPGKRQLKKILTAVDAHHIDISDRCELIAASENVQQNPDRAVADARIVQAQLCDRAVAQIESEQQKALTHERALAAKVVIVTTKPKETLLGRLFTGLRMA